MNETSHDIKTEADRLLAETPDLTDLERAYLEECKAGKHDFLVFRCKFNVEAPYGILLTSTPT